MQRTLNAFENAFDRLAAGYFLFSALGGAAAGAGVVLNAFVATGGLVSKRPPPRSA